MGKICIIACIDDAVDIIENELKKANNEKNIDIKKLQTAKNLLENANKYLKTIKNDML